MFAHPYPSFRWEIFISLAPQIFRASPRVSDEPCKLLWGRLLFLFFMSGLRAWLPLLPPHHTTSCKIEDPSEIDMQEIWPGLLRMRRAYPAHAAQPFLYSGKLMGFFPKNWWDEFRAYLRSANSSKTQGRRKKRITVPDDNLKKFFALVRKTAAFGPGCS